MNKALAQTQYPADAFASELQRVVHDFVANATDEDVDQLLRQASEGFSSRIETEFVINPGASDLPEFVEGMSARIFLGEAYAETSDLGYASTVHWFRSASAANRHDLALAA